MLAGGQTWHCGYGQKGEGKGLLASVELEGEENGGSLSFSWFVIACFTWKNCIFAGEWRDNCITV